MSDTPWKQAIEQILRETKKPMSANQLADAIVTNGIRENVGSTPEKTVAARISGSIAKNGSSSPFVRVARGRYTLKDYTKP